MKWILNFRVYNSHHNPSQQYKYRMADNADDNHGKRLITIAGVMVLVYFLYWYHQQCPNPPTKRPVAKPSPKKATVKPKSTPKPEPSSNPLEDDLSSFDSGDNSGVYSLDSMVKDLQMDSLLGDDDVDAEDDFE